MSGSVIGNSSDPTAATTAQWGAFNKELGTRFANNTKVIFGLMNEPHDMPSSLVLANNQAAINGIRDAGAKQLILVPGTAWTGGHGWTKYGDPPSSQFVMNHTDPLNNWAIEFHEVSPSSQYAFRDMLTLHSTLVRTHCGKWNSKMTDEMSNRSGFLWHRSCMHSTWTH
jgi:aryl-phospho-beta-D-glucosidase BglC (GH1 family)